MTVPVRALQLVVALVALVSFCTTAVEDNRTRRRPTYDWLDWEFAPPAPANPADVRELWFTQKLDHFNSTNNDTWRQRYFRNDEYYQPGNPVFLFIGGEFNTTASWVSGGFMFTLGTNHSALMLALEHRFYGLSRPTRDLSTANLRYLNSTQALEDLAYFIRQLRQENPQLNTSKWVVFGGSYGGNLATWARLRYPDIINGAVASSAPVLAQAYFPEYLEVVAQSMQTFDPQCVSAVAEATQEFGRLLGNDVGIATISELFGLCRPLNVTQAHSVAGLTSLAISNFSYAAQNNEVSVGRNSTLQQYCRALRAASGETPLRRLTTYLNFTSETTCFDPDFNWSLQSYRNISWGGTDKRQWIWQTCTEFGYHQTTDSPNHPFGTWATQSYFNDMCTSLFGPEYTPQRLEEGVRHTNQLYGGRTPNVTNVAFVHGALDPWHRLGVLEDLGPSSPAIIIANQSHCSDIYSPTDLDTPQLQAAHHRIRQLVAQWIS